VLAAIEPQSAWAAEWVDVSDQYQISLGQPVRSRRSPDASVTVSLINNSNDMVGDLRMVISGLQPETVSIQGGTTVNLPSLIAIDGSSAVVVTVIGGGSISFGFDVSVQQYQLADEPDLDGDGTPDSEDDDRDGDGVANGEDIFPNDGSESADLDGDGLGDNTDPDRDGDGVENADDPFPEDPTKFIVTTIKISSPASLVTIGASPVTVTGEISVENAALTINGSPVNYTDGKFEASVSLQEGHNSIVASIVATDGQQATDSISVSLDLTPPYITVESHQDGQDVYSDSITVTGLINDIVRGTIEDEQANVSVNGLAASIANRSYSVSNIPLAEGLNTITVAASDQVGNASQLTFQLNYIPPSGKRLEMVAGDAQSATIGFELPQPLVVKVLDDNLQPLVDTAVVFRVTKGSGAVAIESDGEARAVVVTTGADGVAGTRYRVGTRVGVSNHSVVAKVVGYDDEVIFYASATGKIGNKLSVNSGNNQRGAVGQILPAPLVVSVTDDGANVVAGARVTFDVTKGAGHFQNDESSYEVQTDSDGRATAQYTLGQLEGVDAQRITATLVDAPEGQTLTAGFTATAFVPADPGLTAITGIVLDNQDGPIPGVTIRVEGSTRTAVADEEGQFIITEAPVGPVHLIADGSTASIEGEFPSLSYNIVTVAGVENPLTSPIYMVKLNTEHSVLAGRQDVVLELDKFPGFKLEITKDSVTFPDGSREGLISVTPVNASKVPMPPPNGMQPQFIVTIQPTGTKFDPPAKLTLPNVDGHAPGTQTEMYSFDHDLEEFVSIGLGTVSEDGSLISSNPGVGVIKAGWHCGSVPGGTGCAHVCGACGKCSDDGSCNCSRLDFSFKIQYNKDVNDNEYLLAQPKIGTKEMGREFVQNFSLRIEGPDASLVEPDQFKWSLSKIVGIATFDGDTSTTGLSASVRFVTTAQEKYTKGGGGTGASDPLGYKVVVKYCEKKPIPKILTQDAKNIIRQEYLNHGLPVPTRKALVAGRSRTAYGYTIDPGAPDLLSDIGIKYTELMKKLAEAPNIIDGNSYPIRHSNAWRNPEKNESLSKAIFSVHQFAGAWDIVPTNISILIGNGFTKKAIWETLEEAVRVAMTASKSKPKNSTPYVQCDMEGNKVPCENANHIHGAWYNSSTVKSNAKNFGDVYWLNSLLYSE